MLQHVKLSQTLTFNLVVDIFTSWITHLWSSQKIMLYFTVLKSVQTFVLHVGSTALDKRKFKSIISSQQLLLLTSKQALPAFSNLMQLILKQKAVRALISAVQLLEIVPPLHPDLPQFKHHLSSWLTHPTSLIPLPCSGSLFTTVLPAPAQLLSKSGDPLGIMHTHKDLSELSLLYLSAVSGRQFCSLH